MQQTIELRDFELEIIRGFQLQGQIFVSVKSEWVRGHLKDVKQDYGTGMYKRWCDFCQRSGEIRTRENKTPRPIKSGTYGSFMTYLWLLQKLQLIKLAKVLNVRPNVDEKKQRRYYGLDVTKLESEGWRHPFQSLYPSSDWRKMSPEKRAHYRRKWKVGRIKKRLGRPPKN